LNTEEILAAQTKFAEPEEQGSRTPDPTAANPDITQQDQQQGGDEQQQGEAAKQQKQTDEENARFARERRERERQAELERVRKETKKEAIKIATKGVNPYTTKPIETDEDVEEFEIQVELEKAGKDPVADLAAAYKDREAKRIQSEKERKNIEESTKKDLADFKQKHPDVDVANLMSNPVFRTFTKYALGKEPLTSLYEDFLKLSPKQESKQETEEDLIKKAQQVANANATPGALGKPGAPTKPFYTVDQIKKMSQKEVDADYDHVMASLRHHKVFK